MSHIRCNQCYWVGKEEDLEIFDDTDHCPDCGEYEYLIDIDLKKAIETLKEFIKVHKNAIRNTTTLGSKTMLEQELEKLEQRLIKYESKI